MGVNKQILGGEVVWKFNKPCPFNKRVRKSLRPQTDEFSQTKKGEIRLLSCKGKKKPFHMWKERCIWWRCTNRNAPDFFFPFLSSPTFFWFPFKIPYKQMSWVMLPQLVQQTITLSCRTSFPYQPMQDQVPLSPSTLAHYVCPCPGWQCPAGVCRLPVPALPCGWNTRSRLSHVKPTSAQTLWRPVASPPLWPVSPCMWDFRALWTAGN